MSWRFTVLTAATLWVKWICLNLFSVKWLRTSLNLVCNLTPLGLSHLKTLLPEGSMDFKSLFLKIIRSSVLHIFWSSLFHSITTEGKKILKKCFILNWGILLVFLVLYGLIEIGYWIDILEIGFWIF